MTHVGDSFQQPANTFSAKNVIHDFYRTIPSDQRYRGNSELVLAPTAPLSQMAGDNTNIDFLIPGKSVNGVLMVQDMQLVIDVKLTNMDGSRITAGGAYASVTNNVLNSLFEAIEIKSNEQSINKQSASGHPYKRRTLVLPTAGLQRFRKFQGSNHSDSFLEGCNVSDSFLSTS